MPNSNDIPGQRIAQCDPCGTAYYGRVVSGGNGNANTCLLLGRPSDDPRAGKRFTAEVTQRLISGRRKSYEWLAGIILGYL